MLGLEAGGLDGMNIVICGRSGDCSSFVAECQTPEVNRPATIATLKQAAGTETT